LQRASSLEVSSGDVLSRSTIVRRNPAIRRKRATCSEKTVEDTEYWEK
jgi:hypothetical protein